MRRFTEKTLNQNQSKESPGLDLLGLKSGIQFSMTSKITRQMIHQAHNSAGVLLCAPAKEPFTARFKLWLSLCGKNKRERSGTRVSSYGCVTHHSHATIFRKYLSNTHSLLLNDTGCWWEWEWRWGKEKERKEKLSLHSRNLWSDWKTWFPPGKQLFKYKVV